MSANRPAKETSAMTRVAAGPARAIKMPWLGVGLARWLMATPPMPWSTMVELPKPLFLNAAAWPSSWRSTPKKRIGAHISW